MQDQNKFRRKFRGLCIKDGIGKYQIIYTNSKAPKDEALEKARLIFELCGFDPLTVEEV